MKLLLKFLSIFGLIFLVLLISNCKGGNKSNRFTIIDFDSAKKADFFLSDIASDITYIPLDTARYFNYITCLKIYDDYIFAATSEGFFIYDREGKFIREIGRKGRGPEEISYIGDFDYDPNQKQIYILAPKKIRVYSLLGNFIKNIHLKNRFDKIQLSGDNLFLFESIKGGFAKYDWLITTLNGDSTSSKLNSYASFKSGESQTSKPYEYCNKVYNFDCLKDTVYEINNNGQYQVKYLFQHKKPLFLGSDYSETIRRNSYHLSKMFETSKYIFLSYGIHFSLNQTLFNKKTKEFSVYGKADGPLIFQPDYFFNDIDGGKWNVINYCFPDDKGEYLCLRHQVLELKDFIHSDEFKNEKVKYPERKEKYRQFVENLKDDANPVLMIVKLKQ